MIDFSDDDEIFEVRHPKPRKSDRSPKPLPHAHPASKY